MWNLDHFKREVTYYRHCVGEVRDNLRVVFGVPRPGPLTLRDKVFLVSDALMELVCDFVEAFHYTIGHALVYGGLAWLLWSLSKLFW
jgi:hypothetical protein